jgi:ribonuclease J
LIEKALATAAGEGIGDPRHLEQLIVRAVESWAFKTYRRNPMIIPVVVEA